jgi:hypothetical protein
MSESREIGGLNRTFEPHAIRGRRFLLLLSAQAFQFLLASGSQPFVLLAFQSRVVLFFGLLPLHYGLLNLPQTRGRMYLVLSLLVLVLPFVALAVVAFGSITGRMRSPAAPFVALARPFLFLLGLASTRGGLFRWL